MVATPLRVGMPDRVSPRTLLQDRSLPPGPSPDPAAGARATSGPGRVSSPRWNREEEGRVRLSTLRLPGSTRNQREAPGVSPSGVLQSASPAVLRWTFCPRSPGRCRASVPHLDPGPGLDATQPAPRGNSQPQGESSQEMPSRAGRGRRLAGRRPPHSPAV
ncbi:hypothetical protein NDU88_004293 [Pleurodeles waltl]|uniref:Uncharacterized protein n=1 Tax=Pleurodeles waltl TaxID=8319 RepID=A0AAV7PJE6_PLEWA|nr:hypothetical protein NDU88_004293 [Pleurodeles waltl]